MGIPFEQRRILEQSSRANLERWQLERLNQLAAEILPHNAFYADKLAKLSWPLANLEDLRAARFTTKEELVAGAHERGWAANHTWPRERYVRFHRTSGTHGRPLVVCDTPDDWNWWLDGWQFVLDAAGVSTGDRALLAFSFGPFIGFWSAHDALVARGVMVIPTGGLSSLARLELARTSGATVLLCTPTYALHLAETAREHNFDLPAIGIRKIIVAGEPGGSAPTVRARMEEAWNARVFDHAGATEVGPWGYADAARRGLVVNEALFAAEFLGVGTERVAAEGELAELVLTSLGRTGAPVIRYRTGDLVRPAWPTSGDNRFVHLPGGVLGRTDDMLIVRGVNIFPSSLDQILRSFPEVVEYRITARKHHELDVLAVEVEDRLASPDRIAAELQLQLGLRVDVTLAPLGSLPRETGKSARFVDLRKSG